MQEIAENGCDVAPASIVGHPLIDREAFARCFRTLPDPLNHCRIINSGPNVDKINWCFRL